MSKLKLSRIFLSFFLMLLSAQVFAFDSNDHFFDGAVSDDGEWISLVAGRYLEELPEYWVNRESNLEESVWAFRKNAYWMFPVKLITFDVEGSTFPSVVYNRQNNSFLVYHNTWNHHDKTQNGFYEFFFSEKEQTYSPDSFKFTDINMPECGKLYSNESGIWFAQEYDADGKNHINAINRNTKFYKVDTSGLYVEYYQPEALKQVVGKRLTFWDNKVTSHILQDVVFPTKNGLIIPDDNEETWWYFNCVSEKLKIFTSYEQAEKYDVKLEKRRDMKKFFLTSRILILCIIIILILISAVILVIVLISRKKKDGVESAAVQDPFATNRLVYETQEIERANLSRDIHDSVIQDMRGIRLETEMLNVQEDSLQRQHQIEKMATDCVIKLRNICYNLTPAELATHVDGNNSRIELVSILQTLSEQFTERTKIPCNLKVDKNFTYPVFTKEVSLNLFRVVQEALNNIEKHSYATSVSIFIKEENKRMKIFITDDGVGFNPDLVNVHKDGVVHFGLQMMQERIALIGGSIQFLSGRNDGTEIRLEIER